MCAANRTKFYDLVKPVVRHEIEVDNFCISKSSSVLGIPSLYFKMKSIVRLTDKFLSLRSNNFASDLVSFSPFHKSIQGTPN